MKKALSLILALVLCLSLCACGKANIEDIVIGSWQGTYILGKNAFWGQDEGDIMVDTLDIYKGGTGTLHEYNQTKDDQWSDRSFSWEITDDVLNIRLNESWIMTFTYDESTATLTRLQDKSVFTKIDP